MSQRDGGQVPQFAPNGSEADPLDSVPTLEGLIETGGDEYGEADLPLKFHPAAIRASAGFAPVGAMRCSA